MNSPASLATHRIQLRLLEPGDAAILQALAAEDISMWDYFTLNLADPGQFQQWWDTAERDRKAGTRLPFVVLEKESGAVAGSMSLMNYSPHDLRIEIGSSWLGQAFRGSGINRHTKYALMHHCFETLRVERVEFKTDVLNTRARQGLRNIGGVEEGILRSHMTMWNNRRRSSVFYSVLKDEWPMLKDSIFAGIELLNESD